MNGPLLPSGLPIPAERVLVCVISGGRPLLKDRGTRKLLPMLRDLGWDTEWVVREDHVVDYEPGDGTGDTSGSGETLAPFNVIPFEWTHSYARSHWRHRTQSYEQIGAPTEEKPGGFLGAFPGREWAMRTGQERGYDLVLQLDDNVMNVGPISAQRPAYQAVTSEAEVFALLVHFAMSTNAALCGLQLSSVIPKRAPTVIRPGFPYSAFLEKTGAGRLPYYGPFEDDIMHALEYGLKGGPNRTVAVVESLTYAKESTSTNGMRTHYNSQRGLEIAKRYPNNVKLSVGRRTSSPNDTSKGMRHWLNTKGFTPVRITHPTRFALAETRLRQIMADAVAAHQAVAQDKMRARADGESWGPTESRAARERIRAELDLTRSHPRALTSAEEKLLTTVAAEILDDIQVDPAAAALFKTESTLVPGTSTPITFTEQETTS